MTLTMEDNQDSSVVLPNLKLSRVSRKPRNKRIAETTQNPKTIRRKRQRKRADVPIPSFSPVHTLDEIDISVLDSPVKKEEKEEENVVLFPDEDEDDNDDDLLDAPPTFAPTQSSKQSESMDKKSNIQSKIKRDNRKKSPVRQVSSDDDKATAVTKLDADDELPDKAAQTIDTLLKELDHSQLKLRDIVNMVVAKHDYDGNEGMRRLIRAHIRSCIAEDGSVAEPPVELLNAETLNVEVAPREPLKKQTAPAKKKPAKVKPDEQDLIVLIDGLFVQADADSTTQKEFIVALEGKYGAKLHKTSKIFAKARLKGLLEGTIEPTVSFPSQPCSKDTGSLLKKSSNHQQNDEYTKNDNYNIFVMQDEDVALAINDTETRSTAPKKKDPEFESTKPSEEQPVAPAEKTEVKPKTKRRCRPPKKPNHDEVVETDESTSNALSDEHQQLAEKQALKPNKPAAPTRPRASRAKKGTCALCTTCTCTIGKETNVSDASRIMSRNDAEIERALIRRTQRLEKIVDKYEELLDQVNRELKKHRRSVWKKQEAQLNDGRRLAFGDSRFLPDADVWDEQAQAVHLEALPSPVVKEARETIFGNGNCQITLTQMFGGGIKEKDEDADQNILDSTELDNNEKKMEDISSQSAFDDIGEDKDDVAVDDDDETPEPEPVDHIHRVSWRNGTKVETQSPLLRSSGAWSALIPNKSFSNSLFESNPPSPQSPASSTRGPSSLFLFTSESKYNCAWDALFLDDGDDDDDARIDQLLDLFEDEMVDCDDVTSSLADQEGLSQESQFEAVILSQRGESIAGSIEKKIMSDSVQLKSIVAACPRWRENIRYVLASRGEAEIRQALERVRRSKGSLQATKEKVSTVWNRQEVVLELFEATLSASLSRLEADTSLDSDSTKPASDGMHMTASAGQEKKEVPMLSPIMEGDEVLTQSSQKSSYTQK